jgi:hypothetical protein
MNLPFLLHQTICGAIAAAGFGVLFNIGFRSLPWCAASGALALAVRTYCLGLGWNLEAASFAAALTVGPPCRCCGRARTFRKTRWTWSAASRWCRAVSRRRPFSACSRSPRPCA